MRLKRRACVVCLCLVAIPGCNLLTPLVFIGDHKRRVAPEFDKLPDKRVAFLVWTDASTEFDYPHARFELATYASNKLSVEMAQRNLGTDVIDSRDVETLLQQNLDARIGPEIVGRAMGADYVVYIEVLGFQMRDPDQPQFLQGRIAASVVVHDIKADPDMPHRYELEQIECVFPDGPPILMAAANAPRIREATYRMFAERIARKFYEHTVDMQ